MDRSDRERIQKNLVPLSKLVNVHQISELLIRQGVIDHEFLERIEADKNYPTTVQKNEEFFLMYTKRGPKAFSLLVQALMDTGHVSECRLLAGEDEERSRPYRAQKNSVSSVESPSESESLSSTEGNSNSNGASASEGVRPMFGSPESSASGSAPYSVSSSGGSEAEVCENEREKSPAAPPFDISPSQAIESLNISGIPQNQEIILSPPPSPIITTPIKKATTYNQGKTLINDAYPMMTAPRGYALIINNIDFPTDPQDRRAGAEHDSENLRLLLEELGFKTTVRYNMTRTDLKHPLEGILKKFSDQFHGPSTVDACVVAIMSHGTEESKIRTSDPGHTYVDLYDDIIKPFNNSYCQQLYEKPKIFIVQACRGGSRDIGTRRTQTDGRNFMPVTVHGNFEADDKPNDFNDPSVHPSFEDILICYSTVPGFVANRDTQRGTWYIQCLVESFREHAHELEITAILRKVGLKMRVVNNEYGEKQMSSFKNIGFHRELYFNPGLFANDTSPQNSSQDRSTRI